MNTGEGHDGGGGYEKGSAAGGPEKRFSMNYQDFVRQQATMGGDAKEKRLPANRLDALAVPISGYWDVDDDAQKQAKRVASDPASRVRWRTPTKRFSMNYMDFKDWDGKQKKPRGKKPKRFSMNYQDLVAPRGRGGHKMNQKRFTMNFQDMQQQPDENGWPDEEAESGGGGPAEVAILTTTTAQTEDTKRAPPSPPTESALDMGGGRRRGKQLLEEKNLQSARRVFGMKG